MKNNYLQIGLEEAEKFENFIVQNLMFDIETGGDPTIIKNDWFKIHFNITKMYERIEKMKKRERGS